MVSKRRKKRKIKKSKVAKVGISELGFTKTGINLPSLLGNSLAIVNELSKGLSVAMPNQVLFKGYNNALNLQKATLDQVNVLNEKIKLSANQLDNITSKILAPVSATIVDIGLATANASQLFELDKINKSALLSTQKLTDLCLDTLKEQQGLALSNLQSIYYYPEKLNRLVTESAASIRMVTNGLGEVIRSTPMFPSTLDLPSLKLIREKTFITKDELTEHQKKLDKFLQKADSSLIKYRLACWETFNGKGSDYIGQASSSMRRLVDNLLRTIAPDKEVVKTNYFRTSPNAKTESGRPTRKARIYYATDYGRKRAKYLERLTKGLLSMCENLSAWDHQPIKNDDFVRGTFIAIEGNLLSLLSELRKKR